MRGVWRAQPAWYERRRSGHLDLWQFVSAFVKVHRIASMLEVGGGHGYASTMVKRYCGIERNPLAVSEGQILYPTAEFIEGDFCSIDTSPFRGRYELVLACAVIEHCPSFEVFLSKALAVEPRHVLVSFFRGLDRERDEIHSQTADDTSWSAKGGVYYDNSYSQRTVTRWLESQAGVRWRFRMVGEDTVLMIERQEVIA